MTDEIKRKHQRIELNQSIPVIDMINGGELGQLVNVSLEGIMIIADQEIPIQSIYQLALKLPTELHGSYTINLGTDCLWCRKTENFHRYWAGLHIIDASDQAMAQLQELIDLYGI